MKRRGGRGRSSGDQTKEEDPGFPFPAIFTPLPCSLKSRPQHGIPCGGSTSAAGQSSFFDGTSDVRKVLFTIENVLARDLLDKDHARELMRYLDGATFEFYYKNFALDGELTADGSEYDTVKEALFKMLGRQEKP